VSRNAEADTYRVSLVLNCLNTPYGSKTYAYIGYVNHENGSHRNGPDTQKPFRTTQRV
jgi:hypothetical protein